MQVGPDRVKPVVSRLSAKAGQDRPVAFRLSERGARDGQAHPQGQDVRTVRTPRAVSGSQARQLRRPAAGRYRVVVTATDLEGNKRTARTSVTVR